MTREEAMALLERYSNYDGMGIQNLAGCKEAMKVAVESLKEAFPELAESEDERIRKWIANYIHRGVFDEEEYPMALKAIEWLEKQKENPKSADSIPSDCVSNAKCEDRWHKVGDSLPDNPREVLCKDEAGNYFIGRYYIGEGWEISNYDDEDKPHHLNPPVSKWIDFPLEKQKEREEPNKSLEEAAEEYTQKMLESWRFDSTGCRPPRESFIAGAEWQASQMPMPEDTALFNKGVAEGRRLEREDMLGDEISCEIDWYDGPILNYPIDQLCEVLSKMDIDVGDKVRIVVLKEEEE